METIKSLNSFFEEELRELSTDNNTRAYIISILSKFKNTSEDLSNQSITVLYSAAKFNSDFHKFQKIGDYLFFSFALYPESLNGASSDYYCSIAQLSYFSCSKLIREWRCFERLADEFKPLTEQTKQLLHFTNETE